MQQPVLSVETKNLDHNFDATATTTSTTTTTDQRTSHNIISNNNTSDFSQDNSLRETTTTTSNIINRKQININNNNQNNHNHNGVLDPSVPSTRSAHPPRRSISGSLSSSVGNSAVERRMSPLPSPTVSSSGDQQQQSEFILGSRRSPSPSMSFKDEKKTFLS